MSVSYKDIKDIFARGADPLERFQEIRFRSCNEARDQIVATMQFKIEQDFHNVVLTQADLAICRKSCPVVVARKVRDTVKKSNGRKVK